MRFELDAGRPQVLGVGPAHLIVGHGPDETRGATEYGDPCGGVGDRSTRDEARGTHELLHDIGLGQVDEGHGPLFQSYLGQLLDGCPFDDVEQR